MIVILDLNVSLSVRASITTNQDWTEVVFINLLILSIFWSFVELIVVDLDGLTDFLI